MKLFRHTDGPSISLTLLKDNDNDDKEVISTISGVVATEPRHELLLLAAEAESDDDTVRVLTVTWLHTTPAYRGHKYGWGLLYQLAATAATLAPDDIQYIELDDMTDVPAAQGNLFYLMGFQHRQKNPETNEEYWTAWHPDHPTLGPERLIHIDCLQTHPDYCKIKNALNTTNN